MPPPALGLRTDSRQLAWPFVATRQRIRGSLLNITSEKVAGDSDAVLRKDFRAVADR